MIKTQTFNSFQSLSLLWLFVNPWTAAHQASLSISNTLRLLKLMSIQLVMPPNHFILCLPLLVPSIFLASGSCPMSQFFTSGGQSIGISTSASVLPMNIQEWLPLELTCLISLQSMGALKSLLQLHSSKVSVLRCSAIFMVQLSYLYMTGGKTIALTRWTLLAE